MTGIVFTGSVTPILNQILRVSNFGRLSSSGDEKLSLPSIVRVEPWGKSQQQTAEPESKADVVNELISDDGEVVAVSTEPALPAGTDTPAVGQMVARNVGNSIFRGVIEEVRANFVIVVLSCESQPDHPIIVE